MLYREFGILYMGDSIVISMPENHLRAVLILVSVGGLIAKKGRIIFTFLGCCEDLNEMML